MWNITEEEKKYMKNKNLEVVLDISASIVNLERLVICYGGYLNQSTLLSYSPQK